MTVRDLSKRLDSRELTEWMIFYKIRNEELDKKVKGKGPKNPQQLSNELAVALKGFTKAPTRKGGA